METENNIFAVDYHENAAKMPIIFRDKRLENWSVWDTSSEEGGNLRTLCYPGTKMFLVVFSTCNNRTFFSAISKWISEVRLLGPPNTPILLVGTHSDTKRLYRNKVFGVNRRMIRDALRETKAVGYVKCSAKDGTGLRQVFDTAMEYISSDFVVLQPEQQVKKKDCGVM